MFVVEVQHSSDKKKDGLWFELERVGTLIEAQLHLFRFKNKSLKYSCAGSYAGRPLRVREI